MTNSRTRTMHPRANPTPIVIPLKIGLLRGFPKGAQPHLAGARGEPPARHREGGRVGQALSFFIHQRVPSSGTWTIMLVALVFTACSTGVAQEDLDVAQQSLQREITRAQSLESRLTQEEVKQASLQTRLDQAEVRIAGLDSERMKADVKTTQLDAKLTAQVEAAGELQVEVDEAQALQALLEMLLAWNRKDEKVFTAGFTESGLANTVLALPHAMGEPGIGLRRLVDISAAGEVATIHVMFALGAQRHSVNMALVKEEGEWKIDGERRLPPKIKKGAATVNVTIADCMLTFDQASVTGGNVVFKLANLGDQHHHLVLHDGSGISGSSQIAFVRDLEPGAEMNVAFARPLEPGTYRFQCLNADEVESRVSPASGQGSLAEFTVR